jgi:hypothetical protein
MLRGISPQRGVNTAGQLITDGLMDGTTVYETASAGMQ